MSDDIVFGTDGADAKDRPTETDAPAGAAAAADAPRDDMTRLLGQIVSLMGQSPAHRHIFISDLEWLVLPPLTKRQVRIWRRRTERGAAPVVYAAWAMVTEEVQQRLMQGQNRLRPAEWDGGNIPWLIDLVAPYGGADAALNELVEQTFAGKTIKTLVPTPGGGYTVREVSARTATAKKA